MLDNEDRFPERGWLDKFADAFRGVKLGVRGQSSFFAHFFIAVLVVATAIIFSVSRLEWCILILCIGSVLTAEMFNSALESLSRAISDEYDVHLGNALDIGSAAVLIISIAAAIVGLIIFINRLAVMLGWW